MRATMLIGLIVVGCGGGGGGGDAPPPAPPTLQAVVTTPSGTQSGNVTIAYALVDNAAGVCSIVVQFSIDGGVTWAVATPGTGGDGTTGLATAPWPGTPHIYAWNSQLDGVALAAAETDARFRIAPAGGGAGTTGDFIVDNTANTPPSVALASPASTGGLIPLSYALSDAQSSTCSISVDISTDGGATWSPAFAGPGGDGTTNLASSPGAGTAQVYVWNSFAQGVAPAGPNFFVQARVTPTDGEPGTASTQTFTVNNASNSRGGMISSSFPPVSVSGFAAFVATDGRWLWIGGDVGGGSGNDTSWRIEKRNPVTGALDSAIVANPGPGRDQVEALAIDGGSLYIAGAQETALGSGNDYLRLEKRSAANGALVTSFGTGGVVLVGPLGDLPVCGLAIDPSHLYLAMGESVAGDFRTRIEKRRLTDGALESGFGTGGVVTQNLNAGADFAAGIAVYGGSLLVTGVVNFFTDMETRLEKRDATTGALVTFVQENAVTGGEEIPAAMTLSTTNVFMMRMVETSAGSSQFEWRLSKRSMADLSLVASATSAAVSGDFTLGGLAKVGATIYVTGMDGAGGWGSNTRWRIEKRSAIDFALDTSFGAGGVVLSDPTTGEDVSRHLTVAGGVVYMAGFEPAGWRIEARFE